MKKNKTHKCIFDIKMNFIYKDGEKSDWFTWSENWVPNSIAYSIHSIVHYSKLRLVLFCKRVLKFLLRRKDF